MMIILEQKIDRVPAVFTIRPRTGGQRDDASRLAS